VAGILVGRLSFNSLLRGLLGCLTLVAGVCAGGEAQAQDECPRLADVVAGLGQVLTSEQAEDAADEIAIRDQGASWSIEVRGHASTYSDPARNCAERARVATVFAALALEPADAAPAPPPPAQTEQHPARFSLEAGPLLTFATWAQARNAPAGVGGQARLGRSGERLGLSLGLQAAAFSRLDLEGYGASITRAACDLSGRILFSPGPLIVAGDLGPGLALLRVRGSGLAESPAASRLDVGVRAAILARLRSRLAPFVAAQIELGFRRFPMTVHPSGEIGSAPRLWLGLVAGGAFDL